MPRCATSPSKSTHSERRPRRALWSALLLSVAPACASGGESAELSSRTRSAGAVFASQISADRGGRAKFIERTLSGQGLGDTQEIALFLTVEGLRPGLHGLAIGADRDCTPRDGQGAHYDPRDGLHGQLWDVVGHAGDLGNLEVGSDGRAALWIRPLTAFTLDEVMGRALLIFADPDDGVTQPAGGSGPVVLCGLIETDRSRRQ